MEAEGSRVKEKRCYAANLEELVTSQRMKTAKPLEDGEGKEQILSCNLQKKCSPTNTLRLGF